MNNNINIYALTNLRVILNSKIYNNNFNELLEIIKEDTKCIIDNIDYIGHKFTVVKDDCNDSSLLIRQICTSVCKFLNKHKLDIDVALTDIKRLDDRGEASEVLNNILVGNYVHMIMNIMNVSTEPNKTQLIIIM